MLMETKAKPDKIATVDMPDGSQLRGGFGGHIPEFEDARDLYAVDRNTGRVVREVVAGPQNVNSSRVWNMYHRGRISARQFKAANTYEEDAQAALMLTLATAGMVRTQGGWGQSVVPDARLDAQERDFAARMAMGRCAPIVDLVVLKNALLEVAAAILHIHHQKAAGYLECGLDALADHYGLGT